MRYNYAKEERPMKILVLEPNPKERALLKQTLEQSGHSPGFIETSEQAAPLIQSGEVRFFIGDWDESDMSKLQFIQRVRSTKIPGPLYVLIITGKTLDESQTPTGADDILRRPYTARDLKNRVAIGERIILLANNLANARDQLENLAMFDSLTGLMNRSAFFRQCTGELERARRAAVPISVIALNIDNFKIINDVNGVEAGDEVLRIAAQTIREKSRPYDCIGRWSGDEFVIMLSGVIGADAEKIADRIITGIRGVKIEVQTDVMLTVQMSAGIASASRISASTEVEPLIDQALQARARAKEAGGNQVYLAYI
jgi:diguanylate cyclase (GGDEF)-like protein